MRKQPKKLEDFFYPDTVEKNRALIIFGFLFFGVELLIGLIFGLTLVPWVKLSFLGSLGSLMTIFAILWNVAGAVFLYIGYNWRKKR